MIYVTYDETGVLTGFYDQDLQEAHADHHIALDEIPEGHWTQYRANAARDGLVIAPIPDTVDTIEHLVPRYDDLVQDHLDAHARRLGYTSMDRAVTYASEPAVKKFQAEGRLLRAWRSRYWAACWPILEAVRTGQREIPEPAALIAELDAAATPPTEADVQAEIATLTT